jgi:hypothetical protein
MIKLTNLLKELTNTSHYQQRKSERGNVLDIILPKEAYGDYDTDDAKSKIIQSIIRRENEIDKAKEHLFVIGLSPAYKIKYIELCSLGTFNSSLINKRELLTLLVKHNCPYFILTHNHPSKDITPSEIDLINTIEIGIAGQLLDIQLIDHVIVTKNEYFSFANSKIILRYSQLIDKVSDFIETLSINSINKGKGVKIN